TGRESRPRAVCIGRTEAQKREL
ncbi:uncharacterized protein METZ01_LOCUS376031, partial [marine metagenome]